MPTSQVHSHRDYTIGWVCALCKEQTAATAVLDAIHDDLPNPPKDPNAYTLGSIGKHNIVIACLPEGKYGTNAAATAATWMVSTFPSVRFGLMVGIGGGIPDNNVRLGDVVVSKPQGCFPGVIQWDLGKIENGGTIERTGSLNNPPTALLTSLAKLGTKREMEGSQIPNHLAAMGEKWPRLAANYTRLESLSDTLFADNCPHIEGPATNDSVKETRTYDTEIEENDEDDLKDCKFCDMAQARKRKPRATRIHYGLIASGNMVIKDAQFRNQLNERFGGKVLCVEMEAAGFMNDFPCLVIRGICDYADSHKNKAWQEYAAAVAAAFAKEFLMMVPVHAVEQMGTITSILSDIRCDVGLAVEYLEQARTHRHNQEDEKILKWLSPFDYGAEHSDVLKRWQPGTGQWILESYEFKEFIKPNNKQVLFCQGIPGAGKTVMTATVIEYLQKQFGNDLSIGIAYIYFNFTRQREQTPEAIFLCLLKQIARRQPSLDQSVTSLYKSHENRNTRPSLKEVIKVFQECLRMYSRVFVVIDALDECAVLDDCRETILSEIIACTTDYDLKPFTTSRYIPEISDRFQSSLRLEIRADESDIRRYIDCRLSRLTPTSIINQSKTLQEQIKTGINASVNGMFLLVQLHFDRLTECITRKAIMKALKDIPTGSDAYDYAYNAAMDRINQQSSSRRELAINILSWITLAKRPLSVIELQHALGVEIGENDFDEDNLPPVEAILSTTVGLVTIDEESNIIRLVHYTTQQFFDRTQQKWFPNAETYIAEVCSTYLSYSAFESGCCQKIKEYSNRMKFFKLYKYAVENWKHHVAASHLNQRHLHFLGKTPNLNAFVQVSVIEALDLEYSFIDLSSYPIAGNITGLHIAAESGWNVFVEVLLSNGADADVRDGHNRTPFYLAASGGHDTVMKTLLNTGQVDINVISTRFNYTPLICAAGGGHVAAVKMLLDTDKVNVGLKCNREKTALWYAAVGGHVDVVRLLLGARKYDPDMVCEMHTSALLVAVLGGEDIIVNLLLQTGYADVNANTTEKYLPFSLDHPASAMRAIDHPASAYSMSKGRSPLCLAVEFGHENLVKLFLGMKEVDVNMRSRDSSSTAISLAVERGRVNIFRLLLDSGRFDMTSRFQFGRTLLMIAASLENESIVELLLLKGSIDIDWVDRDGSRTALALAANSYYDSTNIVKLLIDIGNANTNVKDDLGYTPLCIAGVRGNEHIVQLLLGIQGLDIHSKDRRGRELLSLVIAHGNDSMVKLCLDTGRFDVNARDHMGLTPLIQAVICDHFMLKIIKLLLDVGNVNFDARDYRYKRTALLWAAHTGHYECFTALLGTGRFDINDKDLNSETAFTVAATRGNTRIVRLLLNTEGVDYSHRDHGYGTTLPMRLAKSGLKEVLDLLLKSGKFDLTEKEVNDIESVLIANEKWLEVRNMHLIGDLIGQGSHLFI